MLCQISQGPEAPWAAAGSSLGLGVWEAAAKLLSFLKAHLLGISLLLLLA